MAVFGSAWWLTRGDAALATLLRLAVTSVGDFWAALLVLAGVPIEVVRPGRTAAWDAPASRPRSPFAAVVSRRGPPLVLSVL
ncbi:hypothetical protein E1292_37005 [Nonomuraea deserti]|uniref:Uncharacterized protein n=1 Tax=Nonomuraea deserti TaxID=1848322 RepID=A0A4R4VD75_9ACTN|nr:hypothetical protein [Nonomuraea deserti]TDC97529.1 hypothetical protein E1292_37005 [Nonomuraea deserti]